MDIIFIKTENGKISEPHALLRKLTNNLDLRRGEKNVALSMLSIYYRWKNIKSLYNNNKFEISASTRKDEFELPDGSYSVSDIQDLFWCILKKHNEKINNPSMKTYANKIENRITFKTKIRYYLDLLTPETMKLHESTENKITKNKNAEKCHILILQN